MVKSTNRKRSQKTTSNSCKIEVVKEIKKQIKIKEGLSASKINCILVNEPHFLGCFADDHLRTLSFQSFPAFLFVNLDKSSQVGSHWICLRVDRKTIEIFDPLGFNSKLWPNKPFYLLNFLHNFSFSRKLIFSVQIQPTSSFLCGFYCLFYVLMRQNFSFRNIQRKFSRKLYKNDSILSHLFMKNKF